ncbi:MAG: hypothetical protein JRJ43_02315 [Deltaproteobacteria bacterium]|nr:hypothetical protein [Deltaproteobacteria bacterium]MBW1718385.1 hypothetical protein [Deltaproteobacteria bacterium]MBW1937404.1 hypothetical protein [Deltaproteobacteria bacterium]MBW1964086.1 hypothetical protein [Deltaproteobacteria bacterium]MBW2080361.1 hypothetical protein [Deltaproteobacteria bacterium]
MAEIRSAIEIAMEKADRLGLASKEELETEKWLDCGHRIVARYMQGEIEELKASLSDISGNELPLVLKGATKILLRNIVLPRDKEQWPGIKKAFSGFVELKGSLANQIIPRIEQLLKSYEQTRDQYYEQLKMQMQNQLGGIKQAVSQQYGTAIASNIDVDSLPEFQKEWSRISFEITDQFEQQLIPLKESLEEL